MYEKLRNFRTIHPGAVSLVLKYAQNSNENCHEISQREHCAFRRYRAKSRRGGAKLAPPPPPGLYRVKDPPPPKKHIAFVHLFHCLVLKSLQWMFHGRLSSPHPSSCLCQTGVGPCGGYRRGSRRCSPRQPAGHWGPSDGAQTRCRSSPGWVVATCENAKCGLPKKQILVSCYFSSLFLATIIIRPPPKKFVMLPSPDRP